MARPNELNNSILVVPNITANKLSLNQCTCRYLCNFPNNRTIQILYTDTYLILLHVSTVYCSLDRVGIMVHKKVQRWEDTPYKQ